VERAGRVETLELETTHLPRPLRVRLYLPPCHDPERAQPYPLLLMLHGQAADDSQWQRLGLFAAADRLIDSKELLPTIIALPYEQDNLSNPFESGFDTALLEDLLPVLSENYAACPQRACRAIGGLSRGAAWAMNTALAHWGVFAAIGAHSLAPFYGDYNRLPYLAREIPAGSRPLIGMDSGQRDRYLSQARHYHQLLTQNKLPHEYVELPGEHDETYWAANVERYLAWYARALQP
jgi:enterochelin esterase-like enzyme